MDFKNRIESMPLLEKLTYLLTPKVRCKRQGNEWQLRGKFGKDCFRLNSKEFNSPQDVKMRVAGLLNEAEKPLLININYEGGNFSHLNFRGLTPIPSHMAVGAAGQPRLAREIGRVIGKELQSMGITWNFAPVAELLLNAQSGVLGIRSFGSDPLKTAELTGAMILGMQSEGTAATVKHFPGILNVGYDVHDRFPLITREISPDILLPFQAAVQADVAMLMPMHAVYSGIDPLEISTFSKKFIRGLIRERLGYDGVIISDSLTMGSLRRLFVEKGPVELILKAWEAGVDLILLESDISFGSNDAHIMAGINQNCKDLFYRILPPLHEAVSRGRISLTRINESVSRVLRVYQKYGINEIPGDSPHLEEHAAIVRKCAGNAITILQDTWKLLPLDSSRFDITVVLPPAAKTSRADCIREVESTLAKQIKQIAPAAQEILLKRAEIEEIQKHNDLLNKTDILIFQTYFAHLPEPGFSFQLKAVHYLKEHYPHLRIIVVSTGTPYEFRLLSSVDVFISSYDFRAPSMKAVAEILLGKEKSPVLRPVSPLEKKKKPRVAVVIPTNGGKWLATTLSFLKRELDSLLAGCWETKVIVALDGILQSIHPISRDFLVSQHWCEVIENPGKIGKFNLLKNTVEKTASYIDIFVFVDDDILISKGSLEEILNELNGLREQSYLIGAVPIPFVSPFSWRKPLASIWERVYSFNRREELGVFPPLSIPWGQCLAFWSGSFPHLAVERIPGDINDSFLMISAFFPWIKICAKAFYYFGVSHSIFEHFSRKLRIMQGVDAVLEILNAPFLEELQYFYQREWQVNPGAVRRLGFDDLILFRALQINNWLIKKIYRHRSSKGKKIGWKTAGGTKNFVKEKLFEQLYTREIVGKKSRGIDFAAGLFKRIKPGPEIEIYMME